MAALFWGAGFIGSRLGLEGIDAAWVTFLRFFIAAIVCLPFCLKYSKTSDIKKVLKSEVLIKVAISSILLSLMMYLQVKSLEFTTVHKSGFIIILYAFITPVILTLYYKTKLSPTYWFLLVISLLGMSLMFNLSFSNFNYGDFLSLLCAICSAFQIISISKLAKLKINSQLLNSLQLGIISIFTLIFALISSGIEPIVEIATNYTSHFNCFAGIAFMGIFSTAIAFFLQLKSQVKLKSHIAALIFLTESPIAAILAFFILGESMSLNSIVGSLIVLVCIGIIPFERTLGLYMKQFFLKRSYFTLK